MNETIVLQNISKQLGKKEVLKNVSFSVGKGDIFGYLGPNGAGKTTTMRVILGLLKPNSGTVLVQGKNMANDTGARRTVGVLLERDGLYERLSAQANLNYYAQLYEINDRFERVDRLLSVMGLSDRKNDKVGTFSKGMKRKLALAKAIINNPAVLFLDEPSAGLDPEAQKMVRDLLIQLRQKYEMTIFLNSHDLDEVQRICSRVAIIQNGTIQICNKMENITGKEKTNAVNIRMADDEQTNKAIQVIKTLDSVISVEQKDHASIVVRLQNQSKPSDLLTFLIRNGIKVEEVKSVSQSLEEIYLQIMHQEKSIE